LPENGGKMPSVSEKLTHHQKFSPPRKMTVHLPGFASFFAFSSLFYKKVSNVAKLCAGSAVISPVAHLPSPHPQRAAFK
jgi:hypothetical protein